MQPKHKISDTVWAETGPRRAQKIRDAREPASMATALSLSPSLPPPCARARCELLRACAGIPPSAAGPAPKGPRPCRWRSCITLGKGVARCGPAPRAGGPAPLGSALARRAACVGPDPRLRPPSPPPLRRIPDGSAASSLRRRRLRLPFKKGARPRTPDAARTGPGHPGCGGRVRRGRERRVAGDEEGRA